MERVCQELMSGGALIRKGYKLFVGEENPARSQIGGEVCVVSYAYPGFQSAVARILADRGVKHRAVELSFARQTAPVSILRKVLAGEPAGVILWMPHWIESLRPLIEQAKTPVVVCADATPPGLPFSTVGTDIFRSVEIAVRHLFDLGHRQIAHFYGHETTAMSRELEASFRKVCLMLGISPEAVWQEKSGLDSARRETLLKKRSRNPKVTAIFADVASAVIATKLFKVPGELSVVSISNDAPEIPLTAVALRDGAACIASWACTEVITRIQAVESGRPMPPAHHALFVPELIARRSTRALKKTDTGFPASEPTTAQAGKPVSHLSAAAAGSPWDSWSKTYAYLKRSRSRNWRQFDLSKLANHSMTREHGWLGGGPLLHFPAGLRSIHGVPFQVIEENRNGGRAVVTFRSPQTHSAEGKELPVSVKLAVGGRVEALYFLHGCGYAEPAAFAEYLIHFKKGKAASIPLIPLGPSIKWARRRLGDLQPNLQDWWTGYEQQDFPHAKFVTVFNPADPGEYERNLYTLEWVNPRPGEEISRIEARVDPEAGPALSLVAVTALA